MSSFFSGSSLTLNQIIPAGRGKRAFSTLFLIAALVVVAAFIAPMITRAGVPTFSGGGPGNGQVGAPPDALVDINASEALNAGTVNTTNVTLYPCTGATDALTCASPDTATNLCTSVTLGTGTNGANTRITCGASVLAVNTTYRFRVSTGVQAANANEPNAANVDRIFRTGGFTGGTNTTPWRFMSNTPNPGQQFPGNGVFILEAPQGPEGALATSGPGSVNDHLNYTLKLLSNGAPTGSDLCTAVGDCVILRIAGSGGGDVIVIRPIPVLTAGQEYEFQVSNLQNSAMVAMGSPLLVRFTATAADATAPTLRTTALGGATIPADAATGVSRSTGNISVFFSESVRPDSINATNVRLYIDADASSTNNDGDTTLGASNLFVDYDPFQKSARLTPKALLAANTRYCFDIVGGIGGVKDLVDNQIVAVTNKCFTTGSDTDSVKPTLTFADADNFKLVAHVSETLKPGTGANGAENPANYTLECPVGVAVNLTGKTITYRPEAKEIEIQGLGCLNGNTGKLTIATAVQDLAGNAFDDASNNNIAQFTILNSTTTGGFIGSAGAQQDFHSSTNFATFWENPERCQPRTMATNKSTSVECEFPVPAALATGAKFILTFPSGFTVTDAAAVAASASFMNGDLNGPGPGITTISGVTADNGAGTVTVTLAHSGTGGTAMGASDKMRFELSGITTPTSATSDARVSIIVKDASGVKQGQTINASPFQIQQAGSLEIHGSVFKDSDSDGVKDAGEGIASIKLFCDQMGGFQVGAGGAVGMMGHQEATTDANGDYAITGLTSGQYGCNLPPQTNLNNANVGGSSPFQNVSLASTSKTCVPAAGRSDCVDFKFVDLGGAGARTLTVNITGGPASTELDAFCFSPGNFQSSAPVMKSLTTDGSGVGSTTLKLQNNVSYDCGIGPHMAFESFGNGAPPPPPTFSFMPPRPQPVAGGTTDATLTFALTSTNRTITGTVVDGSSAGIANVFVHAEPAGCFNATSGVIEQCNGAFAQTKSDGTFTLNVADGIYEVGADGPGLPPSTRATASVKSANVTGVTLKMVKSSTTISGTIKDESGNGIKYAHVSGQRITAGGTCSSFTPAGGFSDSPTDSSGNYTLYTAPGTWCVRSFAPSYGEIGNKTVVVSGSTSQTGQDISATAGDYGTITGTITSGGTAVTSGFINAFGSSGGNNAQIGSDGTFSLKVKAGSGYTVDGFVPGVGPITRQTNVTVTASTTTALGTIALGSPGTITVTVTGISDGFCDARDSSGMGSGAPLTSGTATIKAQAGTYTVRCGSPKTGEVVNQSSVALTAGGTATVTASSALTTRSVAGQVTDGTNNLEGVTLKFDDKTTGRSFTVTTGNQTGSQASPADNLSATSIPEGTYKVTASKKGYEAATTTATVSGGNLDLTAGATFLTLTSATGVATDGETVNIPVDDATGSADYTGAATVIATKTEAGVTKTVVGELDATAGTAPLDLTNGTWTITAVGDNGKTVASSETIVIANGAVTTVNGVSTSDVSGADLDLTTNVGGKTDAQLVTLLKTESETMAISSGGLLKFNDLAVGGTAPEVNIPASALSTTDSSTGKVDMKADTTLAGIDPGVDLNFVGSSGYDITPKDANGNPLTDVTGTVTITMPYTQADVTAAGVAESKLQFASFDTTSQSWETFPTTVDTTNNLLIASVTHFSSFGIIGGLSTAQSTSSTLDLTPPAAATNVRLTSNGISVTATWTDPADSDFSRIVVLRNDGGTTPVTGDARAIVTKGDQRYVDTTVTAGTTYKYILKSQDTTLNQRLTDEYSVAVTAAATGTVSAPATSAPPAASAPAASAPAASAPSASAPVASGAPVARLIHDPSQLEALLSGLGVARKQSEEAKYMPLIKSDAVAFKVGLTAAQEATITNFVSYGASEKTKQLGAGERRAVIRDYLETVGRGNVNWDDVERMTKGEKPVARNLAKEQAQVSAALKIFTKIYGHAPVFSVPAEDLSWNTLMYRIRFPRDLDKEKTGITEYRALYKRTPRSTMDWATVRVLGYVQM